MRKTATDRHTMRLASTTPLMQRSSSRELMVASGGGGAGAPVPSEGLSRPQIHRQALFRREPADTLAWVDTEPTGTTGRGNSEKEKERDVKERERERETVIQEGCVTSALTEH